MNVTVTPGPRAVNPFYINGRTYSCAYAASISVPDFDARIMGANGWNTITSYDAIAALASSGGSSNFQAQIDAINAALT